MGFIGNISALVDKWAGIDLLKETTDIAEDNEKRLADYNRQQLYEQGEDANGKKLKPYKNKAYAAKKNRMNPEIGYGNADHYLTGETSRSIFADTRGNSIIFDAASPTAEFLIKRDGSAIFGLQDDNKARAWNTIIRPPLIHKINSLTGANFKV